MSALPNLIIIGAMKAGTTSLHDYLNLHPDIFMSDKKEIDFFIKERHYDNGIDWYANHFDKDFKWRGESSQDYSKYHLWQGVPKRMFKDLGRNIKFIYILRDPLERVYSHYYEMQYQNCAPPSLEDYIKNDAEKNEMVLTSCYYQQLERYLEYFPKENFKIITLEELRVNKLETLNTIFAFLDLPIINDATLFDFESNKSSEKQTRTKIGKVISKNRLLSSFRSFLPVAVKNNIKRTSIGKKIIFKKIETVKLSGSLEKELKHLFTKETQQLEELTGKKFTMWKA